MFLNVPNHYVIFYFINVSLVQGVKMSVASLGQLNERIFIFNLRCYKED